MLSQTGQTKPLGQKVLSAGVGLIKAVAIGGAMGVGAALVSSLISKTKSSQVVYAPMPMFQPVNPSATQPVPVTFSAPVYVPLSCDLGSLPLSSTVVVIRAKDRTFPAICLSDELKFTCAGRDFQVPMDVVNKVGCKHGESRQLFVTLVDGSEYAVRNYSGGLISDMEFVTVAGLQTVRCEELYSVEGATDLQLDVLKYNLELAFQANLQSIINTVGQNLVSHFFNLGQFSVPGLQQTLQQAPIASIATLSIPPTPSGLSGKAISSSSGLRIDLSWTAVNGAAGYNIYRDKIASGTFPLLTSIADAWYFDASVRVSIMSRFTQYCYKVSAYNNAGESSASPVLVVQW